MWTSITTVLRLERLLDQTYIWLKAEYKSVFVDEVLLHPTDTSSPLTLPTLPASILQTDRETEERSAAHKVAERSLVTHKIANHVINNGAHSRWQEGLAQSLLSFR